MKFQVLMAASTKMTACWDVKVDRRFGDAYGLRHQDDESKN